MGLVCKDDGWRLPDELWVKMEPLLPARKAHPLGCHRPRVPDRVAMNAILLVLRTGMQWNVFNLSEICSSSSAYRRFAEWRDAGFFERFWCEGLLEYDRIKGIDWSWLAMNGAMTQAPLGGEKTGPNPTDRGKGGVKRSLLTEASGIPLAREIDGANRHDMKRVEGTLSQLMIKRPTPSPEKPQGLCLDKGYDFDESEGTGGRPGIHGAYSCPRRGATRPPGNGLSRPSLGRRANAWLALPLPPPAGALGKNRQILSGHAALCLRHHHLAGYTPTGIGS
jgi:putative transposase